MKKNPTVFKIFIWYALFLIGLPLALASVLVSLKMVPVLEPFFVAGVGYTFFYFFPMYFIVGDKLFGQALGPEVLIGWLVAGTLNLVILWALSWIHFRVIKLRK
jgi:hypothetical protein